MWDSDRQEREEDDDVGLGLAVSSELQGTNPGGAGKRKVLHPEDR